MWAFLFDRESSIASENGLVSNTIANDADSTIYSNIYTLGKGQHNVFKIERTIHKYIIPSVQNVLIGRPHFATLPTLSSTFASYPLLSVNNSIYARVSVEPSSYIINTETEKSNLTLLDVLSALGGMYALIVALYGLLYGDRALEPWGWVQRIQLKRIGCGFRESVIDKLASIAYWAVDRNTKLDEGKNKRNAVSRDIESAEEDTEESTVNGDEETINGENEEECTYTVEELYCKFKTMQKRQKALEDFLKDYVVDVKFYDKHHKQANSIGSSNNNNKE
ncbi:6670_t:CDS:2 [Paraglomus occultum]|uniref:6670_t:CDS:1 n=1 Tax=Paraglomus occultum TaxID=144539 RepID=A0A9N9B1K2_9GLOM|nr:6670_t:CDS:2 [Paraglomus occultum]